MGSVSTATDVAHMFEEVLDLRQDNASLKQTVAILSQEKAALQSRLTAMSRERDDELIRATEMAIILDQQSQALIAGLTRVREGERQRREAAARRELEENSYQGAVTGRVTHDDTPAERSRPRVSAPQQQQHEDHDQDPAVTQYAPSNVRNDIRDSRLPGVDIGGHRDDLEDGLRELTGGSA